MNTKNSHGFLPVFAALVGNIFIMILKWVGFFASGSGSLFSEAIHSVADVFNQILLMIGIARSQKPSDLDYPYGYGGERFFWALISACSIFFVGAGVTFYHGLVALAHKEAIHFDPIVFAILAISFLVETGTFLIALKELNVNKGRHRKLKKILENGDPTTIAVLYEDGVAVLGVAVAFFSILLSYYTGSPFWDAAGSILISILLGVMAIVLINKNRQFLLKKSIPEEIKERIFEILENEPAIEKVLDFKSGVLDVNKFHIKCEIEFNGSALMRQMYRPKELKNEHEEIKNDYDEFLRFCVDYADRVPRMIGNKIDEVEKKIKDQIPEIRHIDIEVN